MKQAKRAVNPWLFEIADEQSQTRFLFRQKPISAAMVALYCLLRSSGFMFFTHNVCAAYLASVLFQ